MSDNEYIRQKKEDKFPLFRYSAHIQEMCGILYQFPPLGSGNRYEPFDYAERFSITDDDIPVLLEIACWVDRDDTALGNCCDAPFHAWEALSQLDPGRTVPGMLEILNHLDWNEADHVLEMFYEMLEHSVCRSAAEAKKTGDASRNTIPLILDALREKERHSTTRMIVADTLCNIIAGYPEYRPEFHRILRDELKELRMDCRDWYATCVCELAFQENTPPETVALLEKVCREGYAEPWRYWGNDGMVEIAGFDYDNDPQLTAIHEKSDEVLNILRDFRHCGNTFPRQAVLKARELRDWIIPNLIEVVRDATAYARFGVPANDGTAQFAVHLLAEFQAKEALPAIFDSLSISSDQAWDYLYGEGTYESMPGILNRLIGDDPEFYDKKLRDSQTPPLLQCSLLSAWQYLVAAEVVSRETYCESLRDYLEIAILAKNGEFVTSLICDIIHTEKPEYLPLVRSAFEQELVDEFMISLEHAEECLTGNGPFGSLSQTLRLPDPKRDFSDAIEELSDWAWFREEVKRPSSFYDDIPPNTIDFSLGKSDNILHLSPEEDYGTFSEPVRVPKKPGRNDPCPCGSGKKYKKCCLD